MVDTSRIVNTENGLTFNVGLLMSTILGSIWATWWAMGIRTFREGRRWFQELMLSPVNAVWSLVEQLLLIPSNSLDAANQAAAEFFLALQPLGPLVYPFAMLVTLGTIWAYQQTIDRLGVI